MRRIDMKKIDMKNFCQYIFYALVAFTLLLVAFMEFLAPERDKNLNETCFTWDNEWVMIQDGEETPVAMPGTYDVPRGETLVVESKVPSNITTGYIGCIRASQQSIRVYVDGVLRSEYDTSDERLFGKNSMSRYVFFQLGSGDGGKTLRLEIFSDSMYSGRLNVVYYGTQLGVVSHLISENIVEVITAVFILFIGVFGLIICMVLRAGMGKNVPLIYLCICMVMASAWILAEAQLRQFFFNNATVAGMAAFYLIILTPYAAAIYLDHLQEFRYHKQYAIIETAFLVDFLLVTILQVTGVMDLLESMYITHGIIILSVIFAIYALARDWKTGAVAKYREAAIGLIIFFICGILEIILTYVLGFFHAGLLLSFGLVLLLLFAMVSTGKTIFADDHEKQKAILAGEAKAEFLTRMSHEIRTPINSILGMNEMILRENKDPNINEYAGNVSRAGDMLLSIVNDILDLSKIESGKLELLENPYPVAPMFLDIHNMFEERISAKGLTFEFEVDPSFPMELIGDEIRIKQIIANLMSNAVKYTKKGFISMKASGYLDNNGDYVLSVRVGDSGQGIKEEDLKRLFQRFTRLEEKKNEGIQGTGLGLSIVKELVELMHGMVSVNSQYGVGTEFVVEIPQKVFDVTPIGDIKNYRSVRPVAHFEERLIAKNVTILSVDDNEMNHAVLIALLKHTGIKVEVANSGQECLDMCEKVKYDLIFMDHMMPNMDGIETLNALRKGNGKNKTTKAVALTANAIPGVRENYLEAGFVDYLTKPLDYGALEKVLIAQLNVGKISLRTKAESAEGQMAAGKSAESGRADTGAAVMGESIAMGTSVGEQEEVLINEQVGLSYCAEDWAFYREMLQMFVNQSVDHKRNLSEFFQKEDWENYTIEAHTIKSTAKSIGAVTLSERAKEHEFHARAKEVDFIKEDFAGFMKLYEKVLEKISSGKQS